MKIFNILTMALSMFISLKVLSASTFTNVAQLNEQMIFAGVKVVKPGMEMESHLVQINVRDLKMKKISLPAAIESREVVGIIPTEEQQLLIITQITRGGGDRPQVHSLNTKDNQWETVGTVDCISFNKIQLEKKSLEFSCEQTSDEGEVRSVTKSIASPYKLIPQEMKLPVTQLEAKTFKGQLIEEDFEWTKFKINKGKEEKIFTP